MEGYLWPKRLTR